MPIALSKKKLKELLAAQNATIADDRPAARPKKAKRPRRDHATTLVAILRGYGKHLPVFVTEWYPFDDSEHRCDIVFVEQGLIIEVDGGRHAAAGGRHAGDADYAKMNKLTTRGWFILRFTPTMLQDDPLGVIACIEAALAAPRPPVMPRYEGKRPPRATKGGRGSVRSRSRRSTG